MGCDVCRFRLFPSLIQHFYYIPVAGELFVGSLIFIGMCILFIYREDGPRQNMTGDVILTRIVGISAICVTVFPTRGRGCILNGETLRPFVSNAHGGLNLTQNVSKPTVLNAPCETVSPQSQAISGPDFVMQGC